MFYTSFGILFFVYFAMLNKCIMKNIRVAILAVCMFLVAFATAQTRNVVNNAVPGDNVLRFYRMAVPVTYTAFDRDFNGDYDAVLLFWREVEEYMNRIYVPVGFCFDVLEDRDLVMDKRNLIDESVYNAPSFGTELLNEVISPSLYDIGMWVTHRDEYEENSGLSVENGAYMPSAKASGYAKTDKWVVAHEVGHLLGAIHTPSGESSLMDQIGDFLSYPSIKRIRTACKERNSAYYSDEERTKLVGSNDGGNYVYGIKVENNAPRFVEEDMKIVYMIPQGSCLLLAVSATDEDGDRLCYSAIGCDKATVGALTEGDFLDLASLRPQYANILDYAPAFSADIYYDDSYYPVSGTDIPALYPGNYPISLLVCDVPESDDYSYERMKRNPFYSNYAVWEATVQVVSGTVFNASISPAKDNYSAGECVSVKWGVNSSCFTKDGRMRITMSTDYGKTFDYVLADSVPATSGSCTVELPNVNVGVVDVDFVTATRPMRGGIIRVEEIDGAAYTLTTLTPENGGGFTVTGGAETGIPELAVSADESVYNLCGRKVLEVDLSCGVYIKNGKKVIVK